MKIFKAALIAKKFKSALMAKKLKAALIAVMVILQAGLMPGGISLADTGNIEGKSYEGTSSEAWGLKDEKLDIIFVLDITGSMDRMLEEFREQIPGIMLRASLANREIRFGIACAADYPGSYEWQGYKGKYGTASCEPFKLVHGLSYDVFSVYRAIADIETVDGWDAPEAYTRVLYELAELELPEDQGGWRKDARKLVVFIGDTWTHDLSFASMNSGGDPGRDAKAGTADDLEFCAVVDALKDKGITVHAINTDDNVYSRATMKGMSEGYGQSKGTGGRYISLENRVELYEAIIGLLGI